MEVPSHVTDNRSRRGRALLRWLGILLVAGGLAAAWFLTPLRDYLSPGEVYDEISHMKPGPRTAGILIAVFVVGGLVSFPVAILSGATAIAFGFPWGFLYSIAGCMASALVVYLAGRVLWPAGERSFDKSPRLKRIQRELVERQGIFAMALIRMIPVAPYSLINVVAGMIRFPVRDYVVGTLAGLSPAILATALLADEVKAAMHDEEMSLPTVALAIGFKLFALFICFRYGRRRNSTETTG